MLTDITADPWGCIVLIAIAGSWVSNGGLLDCHDWLKRKLNRQP